MKNLKSMLVLVPATFLLAACEPSQQSSVKKNVTDKMTQVERLSSITPVPQITESLERKILAERIIRGNDENRIRYLYIFTPTNIVYYLRIKGKMTSTSKRLTPDWMMVRCDRGKDWGDCIVSAPDEMGTWGSSAPAKVGLLVDDTMIEVGGFMGYVFSDKPLDFDERTVKLVEIVTEGDK